MAALSPSLQTASTQCRRTITFPPYLTRNFISQSLHSAWLRSIKPLFLSSNLRPPKHRPFAATVFSSLPLVTPDRASSPDKVPKWSGKAIKSFAMGELEARKLKYPTTGTEALLMGVLIEGTNLGAQLLRANGITLFKVREEAVKILGKGDMYFFSPEHPPLTESAQKALNWAVDEKLKSGESGAITTSHVLMGVWSERESAGHKIMAALGFDDDKAKELEALLSTSNPAFVED